VAHENLYKHLNKPNGIQPEELVWKIQNLMQPVDYSGYKHELRLKRGLDHVLEIKKELDNLTASDPHELIAVNECKSIVLCAEMFFRTSLERKETRGWHIREDYMNRDDEKYLKWIFVQKQVTRWECTLTGSIDSYRYKPE
jgi:succinate dehydrogenase/fumarate reductase flavoprotein subunit